MRNFPTLGHAKKRLFMVLVQNELFNKAIWLKLINRFDTFLLSSDGSSPKKQVQGQSGDLKVELEPSPSPGPSKKFNPEP